MAQVSTSEIPMSFYGTPASIDDFPNGINPCRCKGFCSYMCKINSNYTKSVLFHVHTAISELELWSEFIKNPPSTKTGFIFADAKWINDVSMHPLVDNDNHSGGSFAMCMRFMEYIAINGWDAFVKGWTITTVPTTNSSELLDVIVVE